MTIEELLQHYPSRRIKPVDGMAVTAAVWETAHEYHRQTMGFQALFSHGPGILTGLEVIASDPPETTVYILPGVAVDSVGQTIVLPQMVAYDVGQEMAGQIYLLLSYGESRPRGDDPNGQEGAPLYLEAEFSIFARTTLPATPWVELARFQRDDRTAVFRNPRNPADPGPNEIDLRYRRQVGAPPEASLAVAYLGDIGHKKHGRGASYLAQALNRTGAFRVVVKDDVEMGPVIVTNTLVYLVGQGLFELEASVMNGLRNYVQRGSGTLLLESVDAEAEESFLAFLEAVELEPEPLPAGHLLLSQPYLFAGPPPGYDPKVNPNLRVSPGVVLSAGNYGLVWQGEQRDQPPSREAIRSAHEWGGNIIHYALERRRVSGKL